MKKKAYKISHWTHKYIGLFLLIFLAWMSISGVLLNHPKLMRNSSVPGWMVPDNYHPKNWSRSTLKNIVYLNTQKDSAFFYGRQGIHLYNEKTQIFSPCMKGDFPHAAWKKRTNHLVIDKFSKAILAATNDGLYKFNTKNLNWNEVLLPGNNEPIIKILQSKDNTILVTKSSFYISDNKSFNNFKRVIPKRENEPNTISLIRVFFQIHDGSIWGLTGKIIWDIAGIVLFFLCISAFYIWYFPKRWKRKHKRKGLKSPKSEKKAFSFFFKYHKKVGWYFAFLLIVIFFTGMFMRPPLIMTLARGKVAKKWYPALQNKNPWDYKIRNAFYDSHNKQFVVDCKDGIWIGDFTQNKSFTRTKLPIRIFAMGATVFEEKKPGTWIIGSFGGLQEYNSLTKEIKNIVQVKSSKNEGRPAKTMVTGYIHTKDSIAFILSHNKGLCDLKGNAVSHAIPMPEYIRDNYRMPLWNFLFELHNARIFRSVLGGFYILIIPLGGLLGLLILLSGVFDYWYVKLKGRKRKKK